MATAPEASQEHYYEGSSSRPTGVNGHQSGRTFQTGPGGAVYRVAQAIAASERAAPPHQMNCFHGEALCPWADIVTAWPVLPRADMGAGDVAWRPKTTIRIMTSGAIQRDLSGMSHSRWAFATAQFRHSSH